MRHVKTGVASEQAAGGGGGGGGDALVADPLSQFASTTSAQLRGVISDETGTGAAVFATSPTLVTPLLGTPTSGVLTNCTGTAAGLTAGVASAVAVGGITGLGTGVGTALAVNVGSAGAPVVNGGAIGTPSSGTLTNCTGGYADKAKVPLSSKSAAYTTVLGDANTTLLHPAADTTARTFTIDSNANVAYEVGTLISFINQNSAGVVTVAITSDTMRLAGAGTTGSRTLAANGVACATKIATTEWIISGTGLT